MKWKVMARYILAIIATVIVSIIIISYITAYDFFKKKEFAFLNYENITREFSDYIKFNKNTPFINEEGIQKLTDYNSWIQILDENGNEVYSISKPQDTLTHYTPVDIVHIHKYTGGIKDYTVFIGEVKHNNISYSYLLGFNQNEIAKYTYYYNTENFISKIITTIIIMIFSAIIASAIIGFLFSLKLTKPLFNITDGIKDLAKGNYNKTYPSKGLYKDIYNNLNTLSNKLDENKRNRKKLDSMREEWIENISHDLKTPLSSIKGYSEMLCDESYNFNSSEQKKYIKIINEKSNYMEKLLYDLRLTYQLKNDISILNKEKIDIVNLITNIVIDILNNPMYENREINFDTNNNIINYYGDSQLLSRAITNIIVNALVHNDNNTKINIAIFEKENNIVIEIYDNGKGISKEKIPNLFSRYYKGTNTNTNSMSTGLGLAISKQIIDAHKGKIDLITHINKGSKFIIILTNNID